MKSFTQRFLLLGVALLGCREAESPSPQAPPVKTQARTDVAIREMRELWVGDRLLVKSPEHEGWSELAVSPNGAWATITALSPFDAPGTRAENDYLLVNLKTGETIYHRDAQARFQLKAPPLAYRGWKEGEPATLKLLLSGVSRDAQDAEISL